MLKSLISLLQYGCVCIYIRPSIDGIKEIVLLGGHPQAQHAVCCPIDHCCVGTGQVLEWQNVNNAVAWKHQSIVITTIQMLFTYPLELILQHAGDVKAEVGPKRQQTVKEQHHKAIIACNKQNKKDIVIKTTLSQFRSTSVFKNIYFVAKRKAK